jgi:hypothetical protein
MGKGMEDRDGAAVTNISCKGGIFLCLFLYLYIFLYLFLSLFLCSLCCLFYLSLCFQLWLKVGTGRG